MSSVCLPLPAHRKSSQCATDSRVRAFHLAFIFDPVLSPPTSDLIDVMSALARVGRFHQWHSMAIERKSHTGMHACVLEEYEGGAFDVEQTKSDT